MKAFSRRDVLKSSLLAPAVAAAAGSMNPMEAAALVAGEGAGQLSTEESSSVTNPAMSNAQRERLLLDFGWRFHYGNACDADKDFGFGSGRTGNFQKTGGYLAASSLAFDDSDWKSVNLPHDWAVELPFTNDPALQSKGYYPLGRNYPETSIGWYRRVFEMPAADKGKRIFIEFDGAYRQATVVVNGFYIGQHSGGYDPFHFDVTDFVNPGGRNVLLVRVDATESDGWFYEGAGIYRHVWLVKTSPVHVKQWGTFVRSEIKPGTAALTVRTDVSNGGQTVANARVVSTVLSPRKDAVGKAATTAAAMPVGSEHTFEQQITVSQPQLWSLDERNIYTLVTEVRVGGDVVDRYETRFGIRSIRFDAQKGLFLNDRPVKVKGTCNHQDHAGLGAALPDAVQYYRVRKLQEMGCNSLRTSHNPPTPELLDACDELGMLVFDETRMMSSNPEGLGQFENLVRRDRNHPSVFMWSMGNEEGAANGERGVLILTAMKELATQHDGTRPVSIAPTGAVGTGGLAVCDVIGYNYMDPQAEAYHKAYPGRPVIGTETVSAVGTRGMYVTDYSKGYVGSYDPYTTTGRASAEGWWSFCDVQEWLAGGFVWTGFDYRGEPSPNSWPNISSQYGIIDTCGFPKDTFYYYQSWWTGKPVLHLFPHWNWPGMEGKEIAVWVHSNLDRVELLLNGKSLGAKEMKKDAHLAWNVPYAPGAIEARGYKDGKLAMTVRRETTGAPAALAITVDRNAISADGEDVAMFAVEVRDAQGRMVPITDNLVTFSVAGEGRLIGVGNGDPTDQESDKGTSRKAFSGLCMAIIQATKSAGSITVEASSPDLKSARATIAAEAVTLRPQVAVWEREIPQGPGITGLWRPAEGGENQIFVLRQEDGNLTGSVEGAGGSWAGGYDTPAAIADGKVDGHQVKFRVGHSAYTGRIQEDALELTQSPEMGPHRPQPVAQTAARPAVGPPPDGSDPSRSPLRRSPGPMAVVLQRVGR